MLVLVVTGTVLVLVVIVGTVVAGAAVVVGAVVVVGGTVVLVVLVVLVVEVVVVVVVVVVTGVTPDDATDTALVPIALLAVTRNKYDVLFTKPVTVALRVLATPSANVDQVEPPFDVYSTT